MYVLNTFLKHLLNVQFKFLILVFIPSKWLSSPLGCRPARDHPDVYRTSGSGRVRLVSERGLFRAYLGSSVTIVVCQLWRHLDVIISEIGAIGHNCANLPLLELSSSGGNIRICVGIVPHWWRVWWVDEFQHMAMLYDVPSKGMAGKVGVTGNRRVREMAVQESLVKISSRSEMRMPFCNMCSLGITGRVGSTLKILGNGHLGSMSWFRPTRNLETVISLCDMCFPGLADSHALVMITWNFQITC